jgi:ABC-type antimicrobial peptide transport system permease subunit
VTLHVRAQYDPIALIPTLRQAVRSVDPRLVVTRPRLLEEEFDRSVSRHRTMALLIGVLGSIALLLAVVGLYSVMAYVTRQRVREVGVRMALGATPGSILRLIVLRGAGLVAAGAALGWAGALGGIRYVKSQLFGVEATDPFIWLLVSALLVLAGVAACAIPARRAMRIDPAAVLRNS